MTVITIAAPLTSGFDEDGNPKSFDTPVTIVAPTGTTTLSAYLAANLNFAISIPTTATGFNLTAMRQLSGRSVWRLRNGSTSNLESSTLRSYNGGFNSRYYLPSQTDTFVASTVVGTHLLDVSGGTISKAVGTGTFNDSRVIGSDDSSITGYDLRGGGGSDSLIGSSKNDILIGYAGDDTLTGGAGADTFAITNQGADGITDFSATALDVIQFRGNANFGNSLPIGAAIVGTLDDLISDPDNNVANYIIVDAINDISIIGVTLGSSGNNNIFAIDSTNGLANSTLYYAPGGDWNIPIAIADINLTGTLGSANFAFVA